MKFRAIAYVATALLGLPIATHASGASCAVTAPVNGNLGTCPGTLSSGSTCNVFCNAGYVVNGSATSCSNGVLTAQTCTPAPCSVSPPANGTLGNCPSVLSSGSSCEVSCNQGYILVGSATSCALGTLTTQSCQASLQSQTISFGALPNEPLSASPITVNATASSGLTVTFSSLTTSVCTVSNSTVILVTTGTCTIAANQSGNTVYAAAAQVTQSFTVTPSTVNNTTDGPIPWWALGALGAGLVGIATRRLQKGS